MRPTLYALALVLAVVSLMWLDAANRRSTLNPPRPVVEVTQDMYDAIHPGMTVEEVKVIVGDPTDSISGHTGKVSYEILYWRGKERLLTCTIVGGKVRSKDGGLLTH